MKRNFIFTLILLSIITYCLPANAQVFELSSTKKSAYSTTHQQPCVYKPSKLVIGTKTKFVIKGEPKSHVYLLFSDENDGAPLYYGKRLRLGKTLNKLEGIIPTNGILEIELPLPDEKTLVGKVLYIEALVWKNSDNSDLQVAEIMGINGRETEMNAVLVTA